MDGHSLCQPQLIPDRFCAQSCTLLHVEVELLNPRVFTHFLTTLLRHCMSLFAAARNCLAFGPGLLAEVASGVPMPFLIQAVDTQNERRTTGGDRFAVRVVSASGKVEGEAFIHDLADGKYKVLYTAPLPGAYLVHVSHADLGGSEQIPVRGSPFKVAAFDPWTKHRLMGSNPAVAKVRAAMTLRWSCPRLGFLYSLSHFHPTVTSFLCHAGCNLIID